MKRREFLVVISVASVAGCFGDEDGEAPSGTVESVDTVDEERITECEKKYIRNEIVTRDDETIGGPLEPEVLDTESRSDGEYVEVETRFGTTRSPDDGPDEQLDHLVTAHYLVSDDGVYRTEDADADPRDGTPVNC